MVWRTKLGGLGVNRKLKEGAIVVSQGKTEMAQNGVCRWKWWTAVGFWIDSDGATEDSLLHWIWSVIKNEELDDSQAFSLSTWENVALFTELWKNLGREKVRNPILDMLHLKCLTKYLDALCPSQVDT